MSVRQTLARNTAFNAGGRIWGGIVSLVLVSYIVPKIGVPAWGLWALVSVFTGYVSLVDLGIASAFTRYIAQYAARQDDDNISNVVSTGFFFYVALGLVLIAGGWPLVPVLIAGVVEIAVFFAPDQREALSESVFLDEAQFLFRWGLVLFAITNCLGPFTAIQTGLQKMGITNAVSVAASVVKLVATIVFLELGYGVRGLLYANSVVLAVFAAANVVAAGYLLPALDVSLRRVNAKTFGELYSFGWRAQVAKLANIVTFQTDIAIVGLVFAQLYLVGVYRIGEELATKIRHLPSLLVSALLPAASDLHARDQHDALSQLYLRSTKYLSAATLPIICLAATASEIIMTAWLGAPYDRSAWVLRILAVGYLANVIPGAGVAIALGHGRADLQMKAGIIATVANVVLTFILAVAVGFWGVPIATALSGFLSWFWFTRAMYRVVGIGLREIVRKALLWPSLACLPGIAVALAWQLGAPAPEGRWEALLAFGVIGFVFGVSYLVVIRLTPFLDRFDYHFFEGTLHLDRIPGYAVWRGPRNA